MLKTKSVAKLIEDTLNAINKNEQFRVVNSAGNYKGDNVNGVLKHSGGSVRPVEDYVKMTGIYTIDFVVSIQLGWDRIDTITDILNNAINTLNGKVIDIDKGRAIFLFKPLDVQDYEERSQVGQSVHFKVSIDYEYTTQNNGTKYELALINSQFDSGTINTRRFNTKQEQMDWYDAKIREGAGFCEVMTPNINSLVMTNQIYINTNNIDVNELLMKNYAIIKETKANGDIKYYYYFVTNTNVSTYNLITVDLQMDTIQTFLLDMQNNVDDCIVKRACLNRFVDNGDGTVSFDNSDKSMMFESESGEEKPKRAISRQRATLKYTGDSVFDKWLNDYVAYWVYIFLDKHKSYTVNEIYPTPGGTTKSLIADNTAIRYKYENDTINVPEYGVVCYPVYKDNQHSMQLRYVGELYSKYIKMGVEGFLSFRKTNGDASFFYNVKYSTIAPFDKVPIYEIVDNNMMLKYTKSMNGDFGSFRTDSTLIGIQTNFETDSDGIFTRISESTIPIDTEEIATQLSAPLKFDKTELIGANKNTKYNPKLYSQNYKMFRVCTNDGETFDYDYQKIGQNKIALQYTEALQPEVTRYYLRLRPTGLYESPTNSNYMGLVGSTDNSVTIVNSKYAEFIASNKNFWLQSNLKIIEGAGRSVVNGAIAGMSGNVKAGLLGVAGGMVSTATQLIDRKLSIDNLKQSPSSMKNANGDVIFKTFVDDMGVYYEEHDCLQKEKEEDNDFMVMNGFGYELLGNIFDFMNIRHYFNYLEAKIETIRLNISNVIKQDIRQRFESGVRFWNTDNVSYEKENYENWLEN